MSTNHLHIAAVAPRANVWRKIIILEGMKDREVISERKKRRAKAKS
jgi:hypothetical protein